MDPRQRADAALARAAARGSFVVTPDNAVSPMDAASTVQIPRAVVDAADPDHSDSTQQIPGDLARGGQYQQQTQPVVPSGAQQQATQPVHKPLTQVTHPVPRPASHLDESQPTQPVAHPQQQQYQQQPQYPAAQQAQPPQPVAQPRYPEDEAPAPREVGGLVPTVQQPANQRSLLSRRLDGDPDNNQRSTLSRRLDGD